MYIYIFNEEKQKAVWFEHTEGGGGGWEVRTPKQGGPDHAGLTAEEAGVDTCRCQEGEDRGSQEGFLEEAEC